MTDPSTDVGDLRGFFRMDLVHEEGQPEMTVRMHLADDHTMFRQGLEAILSSREGIEVVGTSTTGEVAAQVGRTKPDVDVTQLDMQPKSAEEIISGLRRASPGSRIVVLTLWDNLRYVQAISRRAI